MDKHIHPGIHVRKEVLPEGMTVTAAAKLLKIGRPALSKVLNGNASLSPRLATSIQAAFGISAETLLRMQADYDAGSGMAVMSHATVGAYVPPYLEIGQMSIERWGSGIDARQQLPVLVRTLVHSTGKGLTHVDFPGYDASQSPGWDGLVESTDATEWVPLGRSGWELGCGANPRQKATDDYKKRTENADLAELRDSAFIFVTPQRWPEKGTWVKERRAEKQWGKVRAYDASVLEQWIAQSIPGQLWFAEATGQPTKGLKSLRECWRCWQAGSRLPLGLCLFDDAISRSRNAVQQWLRGGIGTTLSIAADSNGEALAFLYALFESSETLGAQGEKVVVFEQSGLLRRLMNPGTELVPVITSRELELELAPHLEYCKPIIIRNPQPYNVDHDIVLEPLDYGVFRWALESLEWERDDIERYRRESGGSLTVLRRRLSPLSAVQVPDWATRPDLTQLMAPVALTGSWNQDSEFDRLFLSSLAGDRHPESIEEDIGNLLLCPDPPVWRIGSHRGVRSRIDALFTVSPAITDELLRRYFDEAAAVLSEDDPALSLPDDQRWLAGLYDMKRECSDALRRGIADTLVLLAVYHDGLFRQHSQIDLRGKIDQLVQSVLEPLTARTLESQSDYLPAYAEAAPKTFLDLIEKDLDRGPDSEARRLLRPIQSDMAPCPRHGLLNALETLAWSGGTLARTVDVLAKLALHQHDDHWTQTPESCLGAIFRSRLPQTSVGIEGRIQVFERLIELAPNVAWRLCCDQLEPGMRSGEFSAKPRWRKDGEGYGLRASEEEDERFQLHCCEHLLTRVQYSKEELGDLVWLIRRIPNSEGATVWQLIEKWQNDAPEEDRAWLRDRIRYEWLRSRPAKFRKHPQEPENMDHARAAYESLEPSDPVLKFRWLFIEDQWLDEHDVTQQVILGCDRNGEAATDIAVTEIYSQSGIDGILRLASSVNLQGLIGRCVQNLGLCTTEISVLIRRAVEGKLRGKCDGLVHALLVGLDEAHRSDLYSSLKSCHSPESLGHVLRLAPFSRETWSIVQELGGECARRYWQSVNPRGMARDSSECNEAVRRFMDAGRPMDALLLAARSLELFDAKGLYRVLESVASIEGRDRGQRFWEEGAIEYIGRVIARVRESRQISEPQMASIELRLFDALENFGYTPALDTVLQQDPRLYAELVDRASGTDEAKQGQAPCTWAGLTTGTDSHMAWLVLKKKRFLPCAGENDSVSTENLLAWVKQVRQLCEARGKRKEGDYWIGRLLSASATGDDGVGPCEVVREVLEVISNETVDRGFRNGIYGSGGYRGSSLSGIEDQALTEQYLSWSNALQYSHPRVSSLLGQVADEYRLTAEAFEQDAKLNNQFFDSA